MNMWSSILLAVVSALNLSYPLTEKGDTVDDFNGVKVADPYRWLEEPASTPKVRSWIEAQNKVTTSFLDSLPNRKALHTELLRRFSFERYETPIERKGRLIYERNDGLQNQSVVYVVDAAGKTPRVLLDPNKLKADGTAQLTSSDLSLDGKRFLYAVSFGGSDWVEWRVRDIATGKDLPDVVKQSKFGLGFWDASGEGFYYLRFTTEQGANALTARNLPGKLYHHQLGTQESADTLVYETKKETEFLWPSASSDRKTIFHYIESGSINNRIHVQAVDKPGMPVTKLFDDDSGQFLPIDRVGSKIYFTTTRNASFGKVIAVDLKTPGHIATIVPESKDTLNTAAIVGGKLFVSYLQDAKAALRRFDLDGSHARTVNLPGLGTIGGISGTQADSSAYLSYVDLTSPSEILKLDTAKAATTVWRKPKLKFDTSKYTAKQIFFKSKDGTRVPMFVVHKKGLKLDGSNPTILYGYGGFGSATLPWFSVSRTVWMDMGGVFVIANIRGGNEYGKKWHEAAIKTNRQKAFDDFIAAGETLNRLGYSSPKTLAIQGGSNGGVLVGVCMIQRPELFAAAIPEVGVMDLLRFNLFTVGKSWESDYGSPQDPVEFASLLKISPLHTLRAGVKYPATLVCTADTDDRVVPAHSFKFAARLQECQAGPAPVLLRVDTSSGHGASNLSKSLEETRDIYAFVLSAAGKKIPSKF